MEPHTAMANRLEQSRRDSNRKEYKENNLEEHKNLKNKSKERDSNFLVMFPPARPKEILREKG